MSIFVPKLKKVFTLVSILAVFTASIAVSPAVANATGTCPILKVGDYFVKKHTKFVHYIDNSGKVVYFGTRKNANLYNINFLEISATCFNTLYPKQDIMFRVSTYDIKTSQPVIGSYIVMYKYKLVKTTNPLYSGTGTAYKAIDYTIKMVDETNTSTNCGLTGKYSANFPIALGEIVNFFAFKNYNDAIADVAKQLNKKTIFGYPYKNFGKPANALMQTDFRNPKNYAVFNGYPSTATGISYPL